MVVRRAILLAALGLLVLATTAGASSIALKCGGKGARYQAEPSSIACAVKPGSSRAVEGVVRDDSNRPVSGPVTVTLSNWVPQGGGYSVKKFKTLTVNANAAGKFVYAARTGTKITVAFEAAGASAEADVSRELAVAVKKLGGGKVKVTVRGAGRAPIKMFLVDDSGYPVSGTKGKRLDRAGVAVFNLGRYHGPVSWVFEAGAYEDLFWTNRGPTFRV